MEFKVGSLMNLISGKSSSKGSTGQPAEQKIVFKQKPKHAVAKQSVAIKAEKTFKVNKSFKQQNDQRSPKSQNRIVKNSSLQSSINLQGKFRRGTLNKSFKNLRTIQGSKPEIAENSSETVAGKSFKYINSENTFSTGDHTTDGSRHDDKLERTVFVGNLPLTSNSENAITKLFLQCGEIESFRLRSVPLKDLRVSRKVAAIRADFHPDRTSTNAYVVMKSKEAAKAALALNGTVLDNHHLRVDEAERSEENDPRKAIFLGNVSFKAEEDDLWALFEQCGEIDHVRILRDQKTSVSKGAAYVNFKSADSVELALKMEGTAMIHGRSPKIHRCLSGKKSFHAHSSRQSGPRNTDETNDHKVRSKEEKRFQKKMRRKEKREAENAKNEALGLRSRPFKDPTTSEPTAKTFVGVKAEGQHQKRKKRKFNKAEVQRKKVAKILANVKSEVTKHEKPFQAADIDDQPNSIPSRGDVPPASQDSTKKKKKLGKVMKKTPKTILPDHQAEIKKKKLSKVMKKAAPKTILLEHQGEIKKKKLSKVMKKAAPKTILLEHQEDIKQKKLKK